MGKLVIGQILLNYLCNKAKIKTGLCCSNQCDQDTSFWIIDVTRADLKHFGKMPDTL